MSQGRPSSTSALKAAKQLVGSFPHARPPEPETYAAAIAATLAQYPEGVVQECVDPRAGLARDREFPPTVKAVVDWCDAKVAHYTALSRFEGRAPPAPEPEWTEEDRALGLKFLADLGAELKSRNKQKPGGGPTSMGEHIRKAIEERPRQGLSESPAERENRMRRAEALGRTADRLAQEQEA